MLNLKMFSPTIADLCARYSKLRGEGHRDTYRTKNIVARLGSIRSGKLSPEDLKAYRDARIKEVCPQTLMHEMNLLRAILRTARQEWGIKNPDYAPIFKAVSWPSIRNARERRLDPAEWDALWAEASGRMRLSMVLAVETSMRREEMVQVRREWISMADRVIRLPAEVTKTKRARDVPLSIGAAAALEPHLAQGPGLLLGWSNNGHRLSWHRTRDRAAKICPSVSTFHWHDFRHEAISRYAARGWDVSLLKGISGHADNRMLLRYVNLTAREVIKKMDEGRA